MSSRFSHCKLHNSLKIYLNSTEKLYKASRIMHFFPKLLISYFLVIAICICSMGFLSYRFVSTSIKEQAIKSNDKLLDQFRNTVDSLILSSINDLSLKMLQDANTNPYISYYFTDSLEKNIYDMRNVMEYCDTLKSVNPMISSAGFYFEKNRLLISSEGVRSTLYGKMPDKNDYAYYYKLVHESSGIVSWYANHTVKGKDDKNTASMLNKISLVRKIPGIANSSRMGGAIIISIDENVFYSIIKRTAAQNLDQIIICDKDGIVVSHTDKELLGQNITNFEYGDPILKSKDLSGNFIVNINHIPSTISFCSSEYNDWKYITVTPMENLNETTGFLIKIFLLVAIITIFFGILISLVPALKLSNPLKRLASFCRGVNRSHTSKSVNEYSLIKSTIENLTLSIQEQEQKFTDVLPVFKDNLLQGLISKHNNDMQEILDRMHLLEFNFPNPYFCALAIYIKKPDCKDNTESLLIYEYGKINIAAILEKIFNTNFSVCYHCETGGNIAVIINFNTEMDMRKIYELSDSFLSRTENEFSSRLYIGIGTITEDISDIHQSYHIADTGLNYRYINPEKHIFLSDDTISLEASNLKFDKALLNNFNASLKAQDRNKALNDIGIIISTLKEKNYSHANSIEVLSQCISIIREISAGVGISLDATLKEANDINTQFNKIDDINDFEEWVLSLINHLFVCLDNLHSEINSEMVQKATNYIMQNIKSKQLSLQAVANVLYISPSHLSRIFRNVTGVTFIDYVTALKLEYCKDLLLNTSLKIDEISEEMGYSTSQYFISRFKIKYGYTPKEYRCKFSGNSC